MPRQARIDAPGALHHVICRGIERRKIFWSDSDRDDFTKRIGAIVRDTETACYAWALLPNHFHLLLRTGSTPIAQVVRKLLSGYVGRFNRVHRRSGHLLQNRYKSILCQEEPYLLELVRYIHLNPLRAKQVVSLKQLDRYRYSGHSALMGKRHNEWQATDTFLRLFGKSLSGTRRQYRHFVEQGIAPGRQPELTGGGLIRSHGGWGAVKSMRRRREHVKSDERILGDSDFVESVLSAQNEQLEARYRLQSQGYDFSYALSRVARLSGLEAEQILKPGKQPLRLYARSLLCHWAIHGLGMMAVAVAKLLKLTPPAATRAACRGEAIAAADQLELIEKHNTLKTGASPIFSLTLVRTPASAEVPPAGQRPPSGWQTADGRPANASAVEALLGELASLQADAFIDGRDQASFGPPVYQVALKGPQTLSLELFAPAGADSKGHPAAASASDFPFSLSKENARRIMKPSEEFLNKEEKKEG